MQHSNPNPGSQPVEQVVQQVVRADDVIDLRYLFRSWWRGSWFIILAALAGLAVGLWEMKKFQPMYTAVMLVSPAGGAEGGSPDFSGLQSFAAAFGIGSSSGTGGGASSFDRFVVLLGSVILAERLQERYGLLQTVYRGAWDPDAQDWIRPSGTRFERMEALREYFNLPTWKAPSISSLASFMGSTVRVVTLQANGFRQVSVVHEDPQFAEYLLRTVYYEADELLRELDQESTKTQKQYLESKIATSKIVEIRTGLVGLLMQQENKAMLLQSDAPYAAYIIQPISVSNKPTAPSPRMYAGVGVAVGTFIGLLVVSFISMFRRET